MTPCNLLCWSQHFKGISCSIFRVKVKRVRMQSTYICTLQSRRSLVQSPLPAVISYAHILPVTKIMWSLITAVFLHISCSLFLLAWNWFYFMCLPMDVPVNFQLICIYIKPSCPHSTPLIIIIIRIINH